MPDPISLQALLADEDLLRREAGRVLQPGPWKHSWEFKPHRKPRWLCRKCGAREQPAIPGVPRRETDCPIPDPATGPLEVIAEQLVKKVLEGDSYRGTDGLTGAFAFYRRSIGATLVRDWAIVFTAWLEATPAERIVCCLKALDTEGRYAE